MRFPDGVWNLIKEMRGVKCLGFHRAGGLTGHGCAGYIRWDDDWCFWCDPAHMWEEDFGHYALYETRIHYPGSWPH